MNWSSASKFVVRWKYSAERSDLRSRAHQSPLLRLAHHSFESNYPKGQNLHSKVHIYIYIESGSHDYPSVVLTCHACYWCLPRKCLCEIGVGTREKRATHRTGDQIHQTTKCVKRTGLGLVSASRSRVRQLRSGDFVQPLGIEICSLGIG
jgi:hypothetical protein